MPPTSFLRRDDKTFASDLPGRQDSRNKDVASSSYSPQRPLKLEEHPQIFLTMYTGGEQSVGLEQFKDL